MKAAEIYKMGEENFIWKFYERSGISVMEVERVRRKDQRQGSFREVERGPR